MSLRVLSLAEEHGISWRLLCFTLARVELSSGRCASVNAIVARPAGRPTCNAHTNFMLHTMAQAEANGGNRSWRCELPSAAVETERMEITGESHVVPAHQVPPAVAGDVPGHIGAATGSRVRARFAIGNSPVAVDRFTRRWHARTTSPSKRSVPAELHASDLLSAARSVVVAQRAEAAVPAEGRFDEARPARLPPTASAP
jgi:hypothetical protein